MYSIGPVRSITTIIIGLAWVVVAKCRDLCCTKLNGNESICETERETVDVSIIIDYFIRRVFFEVAVA